VGTPSGLPRAASSYVGRKREAREVRTALSEARLVTLTGPGGVGKTRLATAVAAGFGDGAVFVGLGELRDGALLPNLIADRLGLHDLSGQPVVRVVLDHLRHREMLMVLDNCEHVLDACADLLAAVLEECPQVVTLATSRQTLGLEGERALRVPPLPVPDDDVLSSTELEQYDGIRLFVDRAARALPSFTITDGDLDAVVQLCRRLDGLPLAIELAAARVRSLSPRQIAERLAQRLPVLATGPRTAPERQRTLGAPIDWSYGLCSAVEREVWCAASVFTGSFTLEAAEQVCAVPPEQVLDAIDGLLDKSVLVRDDDGSVARYRMLETLREYGHERLDEAGALPAARRRHRDWIDDLTARADAAWSGPDQLDWITRLRLEQANLRAAMNWSLGEPGEAGAVLRIGARLDEYWSTIGLSLEAEQWLDQALAATPSDHPDRPMALAVCAIHAMRHNNVDHALARLAEAEKLPSSDVAAGYRVYVEAVARLRRLDPPALVADLAKSAVDTFRRHGHVRYEMTALHIYGIASAYAGDLDTARAALARMLAIADSRGETSHRGVALFATTLVEVEHGDVEKAAESAREGLITVRPLNSTFSDAYHVESMAWVASRQGAHRRAATLFGAASALWETIGTTAQSVLAVPHCRARDADPRPRDLRPRPRRRPRPERRAGRTTRARRGPSDAAARTSRGTDQPRVGSGPAGRHGAVQPRHRGQALHLPADGGHPSAQHPVQARVPQSGADRLVGLQQDLSDVPMRLGISADDGGGRGAPSWSAVKIKDLRSAMTTATGRRQWSTGAVLTLAGAATACGSASATPAATRAATVVSLPGCQATAPAQPVLGGVRTASLKVPASPFGLVYAPRGGVAFAGLRSGLSVLATGTFAPRLIRTIPLPEAANGLAVTRDGRHVLIAAGAGAYVVDATKAAAAKAAAGKGAAGNTVAGEAAAGKPKVVLGRLIGTAGTGAVQVTLSRDDRYAFVSQEYGNARSQQRGNIEVFDLRKAFSTHFRTSGYLGHLALGKAVVGTALSPDGRRLYVTSQLAADGSPGQLSVIDVPTLTKRPAKALLDSVRAGCNPVRVAVAPDGRTVWVTARKSNALVAFDAAKLIAAPRRALLASVQVGTAPVGLTFTRDGKRILTADSNRFNSPGATTGLTVVDPRAALKGGHASLGRIPTGAFPREFAVSPTGSRVLVANFGSKQIQAIAAATLP
jgi:predicted ATPase/DNA-binding beta-propeller fold protein YncE